MEDWNIIVALYIAFLWGWGAFRSPESLVKALFGTLVFLAVLFAGSYAYEGKKWTALLIFASPFAAVFIVISLLPSSRKRISHG